MIDYKNSCIICEEKINFDKEKFVRLTDYKGKKQTGECFYHLDCWKNRFQITQEKMEKDADRWIGMIKDMNKKVKKEKKKR
jgi:hypothetical protein